MINVHFRRSYEIIFLLLLYDTEKKRESVKFGNGDKIYPFFFR